MLCPKFQGSHVLTIPSSITRWFSDVTAIVDVEIVQSKHVELWHHPAICNITHGKHIKRM
jgi:hypothetical protein